MRIAFSCCEGSARSGLGAEVGWTLAGVGWFGAAHATGWCAAAAVAACRWVVDAVTGAG